MFYAWQVKEVLGQAQTSCNANRQASLPADDLKNYRPVSGLSLIFKLVERVVAKQLIDHIHGHGLDNSYQSAYI